MKTLKLSLLLCFVTTLTFGNVSTKEKEALIAICNATNGDNWTVVWDIDKPINTWHGVVVKNDKVIALDLSFNNLEGVLPSQIGDLENLQTLNLFRNKISGVIPESIGNLKQLTSLNIAFNALEGRLPNTIGNLASLESLELFMNKIEGSIPTTIGSLSS